MRLYDQVITQLAQRLYRKSLCGFMSGLASNPAFADTPADEIAKRGDELTMAYLGMVKRKKAI